MINEKIQQVEEELTRRHSSHALVTMKSLGQISEKKKKVGGGKRDFINFKKKKSKKKKT